jgi:chromate transporter
VIGFGGPAAHIALMRRELVQKRGWLSDQDLLDNLAVATLVPGPNSTELAMHIGAKRAGWRGLWLGGLCFILPAVLMVLALAWLYVEHGDTPAGRGILFGVQPVILAVIVQAIWGLRTAAFKSPETLAVGIGAGALALAGVNEIFALLGAGAALLLWYFVRTRLLGSLALLALLVPGGPLAAPLARATQGEPPEGYSLMELFLVFLKIGGLLYGSGYVLVAFMEDELVDARGWLTEQQLLDAIAAGQFTPGPVFSAATFAGYIIDGLPGALVATAGIFLPSFVLVALTHPFVDRLRASPWAQPFLDGVNAAAIALMAVVTVRLGIEVLDEPLAIALLAAGALAIVLWNVNSGLLVLGGAAAGLLHEFIT